MPSYKEFYGGQKDLISLGNWQQMPSPLTIKQVRIEELYNPTSKEKEKSLVAYFGQVPQKLVLSSMRCEFIDKAGHGDDYAKWVGISITLGQGTTPQGRKMLAITKAWRENRPAQAGPAPAQKQEPPPEQTNGDSATITAYKKTLDQALKIEALPIRFVDLDSASDGQVAFYRNELLQSMAAYNTGQVEMKDGAVLPYVARVYVEKMADSGASVGGSTEPISDEDANHLHAAIAQAGAKSDDIDKSVMWLCSGGAGLVTEVHLDAILALLGLEGINVETTFDWLAKTAESAKDIAR